MKQTNTDPKKATTAYKKYFGEKLKAAFQFSWPEKIGRSVFVSYTAIASNREKTKQTQNETRPKSGAKARSGPAAPFFTWVCGPLMP